MEGGQRQKSTENDKKIKIEKEYEENKEKYHENIHKTRKTITKKENYDASGRSP